MRTIPVTIKCHVLPSEEGEGTAWFYRQNAFEQQETFRQVAFKYRRWPELQRQSKQVSHHNLARHPGHGAVVATGWDR